jgi:acyl-CoA dehydrogenase
MKLSHRAWDLPVFGRQAQHGHCVVEFQDVCVPASHLLGEEGKGFAAAQARLGPGRIHHCMRALGAAERALAMLVHRAKSRTAFGGPLIDQGVVQMEIARSRIAIDQGRLLCRHAACVLDESGNKAAAPLVSMVKATVPSMVGGVIDRTIQIFGAAGVSDDVPLAAMWGWHRAMRILDGPDETHYRTVARAEIASEPAFALPAQDGLT